MKISSFCVLLPSSRKGYTRYRGDSSNIFGMRFENLWSYFVFNRFRSYALVDNV